MYYYPRPINYTIKNDLYFIVEKTRIPDFDLILSCADNQYINHSQPNMVTNSQHFD